jgi:Protein of unknown function (DUF1045)
VPPAKSDLYRFGCRVLDYDCYDGPHVQAPPVGGLSPARWEELTREPRRYGFHATLKAPFHLQSVPENELLRALDLFAAGHQPPLPIRLKAELIEGFAALVPQEQSPAINALAADCVRFFDRFRAPLSQDERTHRLAGGRLSERQISYLDRYGYPYVLEEFRFHMTLTGLLLGEDREGVLSLLRKKFAEGVPDRQASITTISIVKQASPRSAFRVLHQCRLGARSDEKPRSTVGELQRRILDELS